MQKKFRTSKVAPLTPMPSRTAHLHLPASINHNNPAQKVDISTVSLTLAALSTHVGCVWECCPRLAPPAAKQASTHFIACTVVSF